MQLNPAQAAAIDILRAALANPHPETKVFDTSTAPAVKHFLVTGINGNVINALVKIRAIKITSRFGCARGGHWIAGLEVLV